VNYGFTLKPEKDGSVQSTGELVPLYFLGTSPLLTCLNLVAEKGATAPLQAAGMILWLENFRNLLLAHKALTFSVLTALVLSLFLGGPTETGTNLYIFGEIDSIIILSLGAVLLRASSSLILFLIWLYASLLLLPMILLTGLAALAVGPELAMGAAMTYMTAEVCPPGRWTVIQIPADQDRSVSLLRESQFYSTVLFMSRRRHYVSCEVGLPKKFLIPYDNRNSFRPSY
jgi:hypothetical protein